MKLDGNHHQARVSSIHRWSRSIFASALCEARHSRDWKLLESVIPQRCLTHQFIVKMETTVNSMNSMKSQMDVGSTGSQIPTTALTLIFILKKGIILGFITTIPGITLKQDLFFGSCFIRNHEMSYEVRTPFSRRHSAPRKREKITEYFFETEEKKSLAIIILLISRVV